MLRVGAEPVKQICGRRAGRETLCFRGIGVLLIGRILGQLADAVVREADSAIDIIASLLLIVAFLFFGAPVAALFASLFLNGVAKRIEAKYYPGDTTSEAAPFLTYLFVGLRLAAEVIVVTLALLPADVMLPGVGSVATLVANGWLLGREFFELVALRHLSRPAVDSMRKRHATGILGAGIVIALLAMIPVVNFFAPLFGAAFMVHVFQHYQRQERA